MSKEPVYWTTKSGTKINVDHMDLNHLRNTLKMLIRNSAVSVPTKKVKEPITLNGDMAQEFHNTYLSHEDDDRFDDYPIDILYNN
jgi:hypothetical protein